jgi:hypothetical protein
VKQAEIALKFWKATYALRDEGYSNSAFLNSVAAYLDETDAALIPFMQKQGYDVEFGENVQKRIRAIAGSLRD